MPGSSALASAVATGQAPGLAMGMTYVAMAGTIALAMENAVAAQQRGQVIGEAATAQVIALCIAAGAAKLAKGT